MQEQRLHLHIDVDSDVDTEFSWALAVYMRSTVLLVFATSFAKILTAPIRPFLASALHSAIDRCSDRLMSLISLSILRISFCKSLFHCLATSWGSLLLCLSSPPPNIPINPPPPPPLLLPPPPLPPPLFAKNIIVTECFGLNGGFGRIKIKCAALQHCDISSNFIIKSVTSEPFCSLAAVNGVQRFILS